MSGHNMSMLHNYLKTLPTNVTFFTIALLGKGLGPKHRWYKFHFPSSMRIIGFFSGGTTSTDKSVFVILAVSIIASLSTSPSHKLTRF